MKKLLGLLFVWLACHVGVAAKQPNVIVILTDDQGSIDMGAYGATDIKTPNLDKLASEGIKFSQFYAAAPVCSPSRAGLLTGRAPERVGVPANATSQVGMMKGLPLRETTMAEMFKGEGYRTALIGKWHLGYDPHLWPNKQGFDHAFGHHGGCIDNYSHFFYWRGPNKHDLYRNGVEIYEDGKYFPDMMVDEAVDFIDGGGGTHGDKDDPFFMYFAMNMPHYPYQGDAQWLEYYNEQGVAFPRNLYAAFLSTLDDRIGQLITALEKRGLRDDTIIIFQSDHGHSTEERAHWGGGSAGIYRGAKRSLFEGGLRVPAIISWPGELEAGGERGHMLSALDWMPTLADMLDIDVSHIEFDGKSMATVLKSADAPEIRKNLVWEFRDQWSIRDGDWKLIHNVMDTTHRNPGPTVSPDDLFYLVNLKIDPSESKNLARDYPEQLARMQVLREKLRVKEQAKDYMLPYPVLE